MSIPRHQQRCAECITQKWGAYRQDQCVLPRDLFLMVVSYCDYIDFYVRFKRCRTIDDLRYLLNCFTTDEERLRYLGNCDVMESNLLCMENDIPEYLMDCFGNARDLTFTSHVLRNCLASQRFALVERFPTQNLTSLKDIFFVLSIPTKDDNLYFWYLSNYSSHLETKFDLPRFTQKLCNVKSVRCVQLLIRENRFADKCTALHILTESVAGHDIDGAIFKLIWNCHFQNQYLTEHEPMLHNAIQSGNLKVLDFLSTLDGFTVQHQPCGMWIQKVYIPAIFEWMMDHVTLFYAFAKNFQMWNAGHTNMREFMWHLCQSVPDNVAIKYLTYDCVTMLRLPIEMLARDGNWDLFLRYLKRYPQMRNSITWKSVLRDACRCADTIHLEQLMQMNVFSTLNVSQIVATTFSGLAYDSERAQMLLTFFGKHIAFQPSEQISFLTYMCEQKNTTLIDRVFEHCPQAHVPVFIHCVLHFNLECATHLFQTCQLCIDDIRTHEPLLVTKLVLRPCPLMQTSKTLNWLLVLRDQHQHGFDVCDLRNGRDVLLRSESCTNVRLLRWIDTKLG